MVDTHKGECFCGAVKFEAHGAPEGMGYCHCTSCRSYAGGPVNTFSLWKSENVKVTQGADLMRGFNKTGMTDRQYCSKCGGHIFAIHPGLGLTDVYAGKLPTLKFVPGVHLNYLETVMPMKDGLPKLKDFPAEIGGSGETVPE